MDALIDGAKDSFSSLILFPSVSYKEVPSTRVKTFVPIIHAAQLQLRNDSYFVSESNEFKSPGTMKSKHVTMRAEIVSNYENNSLGKIFRGSRGTQETSNKSINDDDLMAK